MAHAIRDDHNNIEGIWRWHGRQEVWGAITEVAQFRYTFGLVTRWGHPTTLSLDHLGPPCEVALCHSHLMDEKAKCPPVWVGSAGAGCWRRATEVWFLGRVRKG